MSRPILPFVANAFVVCFALDGALSLADELFSAVGGSGPLSHARNLVAGFTVLGLLPMALAVAVTPRLPARIFLPMVACGLWVNTGAAPLAIWLGVGAVLGLAASAIQLAWAGIAILQIRHLEGGRSWLLSRDSLSGPSVSLRRMFAFGVAGILIAVPAASLYLCVATATWIQLATDHFVRFDMKGVSLSDREYEHGDREIRLVGMMHLGEDGAYRELVASFATESTVVLQEGVTDAEEALASPLSYDGFAQSLGLRAQQDLGEYLRGLDPETEGPPEWPHLRHSDVDLSDLRPETVAFLQRAAGLWAGGRPLEVVRQLLEDPLTDEQLEIIQRDVLDRRNEHLVVEIDAALEAYRRVIVPWGALHLPEIERAIEERGFQLARARERRLISWATVLVALWPSTPTDE